MTAYVGMPVIYVPRPGRRETEMAALVTAVHSDDRCDLIIFPSMAESIQQPKVPMLSEKFNNHVWRVPEVGAVDIEAAAKSVMALDETVLAPLIDRLARQELRIEALEAKRGPGRPPNPAKAEQTGAAS